MKCFIEKSLLKIIFWLTRSERLTLLFLKMIKTDLYSLMVQNLSNKTAKDITCGTVK